MGNFTGLTLRCFWGIPIPQISSKSPGFDEWSSIFLRLDDGWCYVDLYGGFLSFRVDPKSSPCDFRCMKSTIQLLGVVPHDNRETPICCGWLRHPEPHGLNPKKSWDSTSINWCRISLAHPQYLWCLGDDPLGMTQICELENVPYLWWGFPWIAWWIFPYVFCWRVPGGLPNLGFLKHYVNHLKQY